MKQCAASDFLWNTCMLRGPAQVYNEAYAVEVLHLSIPKKNLKLDSKKVGQLNTHCKLNGNSTA